MRSSGGIGRGTLARAPAFIMFDSYSQGLLRSGMIEARGGDKALARRYLERAVYAADTGDHELMAEIWYWMSQVIPEPGEKRKALENALSHDLHHARARRELAILDGKLRTDELVDPENLPPPPDYLQAADSQRFLCPQCGGRMVYAPDGRSLICEYCSGRQSLGDSVSPLPEQDFIIAMATARGHTRPLQEQVVRCRSCGAQYIHPGGEISFNCVYCASTQVVVMEKSNDLLAPDGLIPHAFDQKRAVKLLVDWVQARQWKPEGRVDWPRGLYVPVWMFNIGGAIDYTAEALEAGWTGLETDQPAPRTVRDEFPVLLSDLPLPACRKVSAALDLLLPTFELGELQPYDPRYLAGWPAELYDIAMAEASLEARSRAFLRLKQQMSATLSTLKILRTSSASLTIVSFKLVLLPVWMTDVPHSGRRNLLLINGCSGVIRGFDA